jgi:hypothetical protein
MVYSPPHTAELGRLGGCRFPGCSATRFVDAHHIHHWADGGETRLDNLVLLCRRHHRLLHEGGYSIDSRPTGEIRFSRPDGRVLAAGQGGRSRGNEGIRNRGGGVSPTCGTWPAP